MAIQATEQIRKEAADMDEQLSFRAAGITSIENSLIEMKNWVK